MIYELLYVLEVALLFDYECEEKFRNMTLLLIHYIFIFCLQSQNTEETIH